MIEKMDNSPAGVAGLEASGTVLARDVTEALRIVAPTQKLLVEVAPRFDGYMAELVGGMRRACRDGQAERCALVVPQDMHDEATMQGEGDGLRIFTARNEAEDWLAS
ncbi:hypothetical protein [Thioclava pacifica]|uniref:DUF4180 domain-containing protein n=1 Tax=Thioclava pacifica DSM 10166 TaxID=1353537 RepID=A0A074JF36_9RHOB|nr:hypothetical protein [Thioclava pacifica]KEO55109.1 hypothetical protein TP2_16145 [Thioclava pacifica DSM 10166]